LKQQATGIPGLILVDFQLMPACCVVGQQCCVGGNRQSVCQIGGCVESKLVHALDIRSGGVGPLTLGTRPARFDPMPPNPLLAG